MPWQGPFPQTYDGLDGRYYYHDDPYKWPFHKYSKDLKPEDIWGHLHERFNTAPIAILDREAWHADVVDLITTSRTLDEFYAMLEERKKQRLDELKSAIASIDRVSSYNFEHGTLLRRLGDAMGRLHRTASVYDAAAAFLAMSEFVEEQLKELKEACAKDTENERAIESAPPTENNCNISSTSEVQDDTTPSVRNVSTPPNFPGPQSQPRIPSPIRKPATDTNIPPKNRKRKWEQVDGASVPKKKLRGTPPASPGPACANQPTGPSNQKENKEESSEDGSGTPTSQQKHPSQKTSINQQPTPDTKFTTGSFSESEMDGSTVVNAEQPPRANSVTAPSPMAGYNDPSLASTQIENPRIHYQSLGWEEDQGPYAKPLPSGGGQQDNEVYPSVLQSEGGLDRPALEHGPETVTNNRLATGS